jgi:hypothetical protein
LVGRHPDRVADPAAGDGTEERGRDHADRTRKGGDAGRSVPEVPKDLFEWPESLKESRSQDHPPETGQQERGEDADLEGPEREPPRS